jgi:hypothetical protein
MVYFTILRRQDFRHDFLTIRLHFDDNGLGWAVYLDNEEGEISIKIS